MIPTGRAVGARRSWQTLYRALVWRSLREGLGPLAFPIGLFVLVVVLASLLTVLVGNTGINSAAALAGYTAHIGATADVGELRLHLLIAPGIAAIMSALGGALTARTLVGTEAGRGSLEALIAAGYDPRALATTILAFTCTVVAGLWAAIELLAGAWLVAETVFYGAGVTLSPTYLGLLILMPLLIGWAGTSLAVTLSLLWPQLAQQGRLGIGSNGSIASVVASAPGVAALLFPLFLASSTTTTAALLAGCAITVVLLIGMTTTLVAAGFRATDVLET